MHKLIVARIIENTDYYYDAPEIEMKETTLAELAASNDVNIKDEILQLIAAKLAGDDDKVIKFLNDLGWVNKSKIEDVEMKLVASKKYLLIEKGRVIQEMSPERLTNVNINRLVNDDCQVVQTITKSSFKKVLTPQQKKRYDSEVLRKKKAEDKKLQTKRQREEKKKAKEIAKARQALARLENQN